VYLFDGAPTNFIVPSVELCCARGGWRLVFVCSRTLTIVLFDGAHIARLFFHLSHPRKYLLVDWLHKAPKILIHEQLRTSRRSNRAQNYLAGECQSAVYSSCDCGYERFYSFGVLTAASVNCRWIVGRETDLPAGSVIFQCRPVSRDGMGKLCGQFLHRLAAFS
jgi:hypothetical protein